MEYYVYLNGAKRGPFAEERVQSFLADGLLHPSDLAAAEPDGEWKLLSTFRCFASPPGSFPPPVVATSAPAAFAPEVPAHHPAALSVSPLPLSAESLGPYSRATLAPNEIPFYKTSLHWIVFLRFAFLAFVVFLFVAMPFAIAVQALFGSELGWFALPLPAFIMLPPALAFASSELVITDRRVLIKTGVVRRQTLEMFISKIESVRIDQGVFGRMLDYGTVMIRGTGGSEEPFEGISRPIQFRNWVQRLQGGEPVRQ
jgi:hypothetical protein